MDFFINEKRCVLLLILATSVMLYLYGAIDYNEAPYRNLDLAYYRRMAQDWHLASSGVPRPFAFRLLAPLVVSSLPLPDPLSFRLLSYLSLMLLVLLFYTFLRRMGISKPASLVSVLFFIFNKQFFGFLAWDYFQLNDTLSLISLVLSFYAIVSMNWVLLSISLVFGAAAKETSLLALPCAFLFLIEKGLLKEKMFRVTLAVLPGLALFFFLRSFIDVSSGPTLKDAFSAYWIKIVSPKVLARVLLNSFVPFSLVPLVFIESTVGFFKKRLYLLVYFLLVFSSIMFAFNNERLIAPAFIAFYLYIAELLDGIDVGWKSMVVLIICSFASSFHHIFSRFQLERGEVVAISLLSTALVTILSLAFRVRLRRKAKAFSSQF